MGLRQKMKKFINLFKSIFIDLWINTKTSPKLSVWKCFLITSKARLASIGLSLSKNEKNIGDLKNKHLNQRCFIIGNGPSLNLLDLSLLKNEITFGVNAIYTNYEKMGFYPTYFTVEDIFVAEDRAEEINKYKHSTKFFGNYLNYCIKDDEHTIWLNVQFKYDNREKLPNFSKNIQRNLWTGGTVSYLNLQIAYYMGFKEVYLIGFDHSYTVPDHVAIEGTNYYSKGDDVNHFNKDYFGAGKRWHDPMVDRMEKSYIKSKEVFEARGFKVFNATKGGKLEVFDRVEFNDLFQ